MHSKIILINVFIFFISVTGVFAEGITITTYYPSPYGSYNQLQSNSLGIGDNSGTNGLTSADVPTTPGDVWIAGNVGIGTGTAGPTQALDINGQIRIRGGAPLAGRVLTSDNNGVASWQDTGGFIPAVYNGEQSITFPNGLILKHGYLGNTGATVSVTFSVAFPHGVVSAQATTYEANSGSSYYEATIGSVSTAQLTINTVGGE